ncbi:DUF4112 domain-containing protein [Singulisphaera sp. PoT]|uniref:DUF4112 domain-containing protein n=1 Tax=Singulisphaera sp. PoT TaxID=3411797 RepID=UPI003BF48481
MPLEKKSAPIVFKPTSDSPGLETLVWLMDQAIRIPGTQVRVGLDAILGLLPLGGDFMTGIIQAGIVLMAVTRYRVPRAVAARMAGNVLLDICVGAIPLVGDLFDVAFKANTRNLHLLRDYQFEAARGAKSVERSSMRFVVLVGLLLFVLLGLIFVGFITVLAWLLGHPLFSGTR